MKSVKKQNLPQKTCPVCQKAFAWRKKWEKVWDEVRYCSDRCRSARRQMGGAREQVAEILEDRMENKGG